jgi:hypothetical protein
MWHAVHVRTVFEREDSRGAQRVVNYLGALGTAALAALDGSLLLSSAPDCGEHIGHVARLVARECATRDPGPLGRVWTLDAPGSCTYCACVGGGCVLFVVVNEAMTPAAVAERLSRAVAVFDRVMGKPWEVPGGNPGGTPGTAADFALLERPRTERGRPG